MSKSDAPENQSVSYKDSLNLPKTDFPIRPDHVNDDAQMLERWQAENLAAQAMRLNSGAEKFILHDGPPYANGHLHLGHAYNKILKDMITKSQRMEGRHVPVIPGWDCHGLPIELKVTQEQPTLRGAELKRACREYAQKWVQIQRSEFEALGVLMDWQNPYLTMSPGYEAATLRAFGKFVEQGFIEKKNKTVPWCASCQTVLAAAEIEYADRKDPSIFVQFPLQAPEQLAPELFGKTVSLLVWTTTPWTLPLNRAVLIKPHTQYVVLQDGEQYLIVALELADAICSKKNLEKRVVLEFNANQLTGAQVQHPFIESFVVPILLDGMVSLQDGTACVHSAPGCGPEDYEVGIRNGLEIFSPLSADGKYTSEILPSELAEMPVADGTIWVLKKLTELNRLWFKESIRHSYPHCWRCHQGLIFRATSQWFCNLMTDNFKERALRSLDSITFIPERSKNSLAAAIDSRLEWCLSRQRTWGVPIVALLCQDCGQAYTTPELIEQVAQEVEHDGIEYWDQVEIAKLIPTGLTCVKCTGINFVKEAAILDVWFDSGISHYAVLLNNPGQHFPADIYLEGRDQARGWFQSSTLAAQVLEKQAPMRIIATHGFTVDAKGMKMSKSLGNVVAPQELIKELGTDGLRLWVASNDFTSDAIVSPELLRNVKEVYRKIRNTMRFLLSNLYDFDVDREMVDFEQLQLIDQYALLRLNQVSAKVRQAYADCKFTTVFHELGDYCATDLSALYLDVIKDRLYVAQADGEARRAAQTVCYYILSTLTKLVAPILSITAEQVSDHYQRDKTQSIHLQPFVNTEVIWQELAGQVVAKSGCTVQEWQTVWQTVFAVRDALLKVIEVQRAAGVIKHPLEAKLQIHLDLGMRELADLQMFLAQSKQGAAQFWAELLTVSQVEILNQPSQVTSLAGLTAQALVAEGVKCPRCWKYSQLADERGLCQTCCHLV